MKYLIALDLDGTTLNSKSKISPKTLKYLQQLKSEHIICLITGRPTRASIMYYNEIGLDTIMGNLNGTKLSIPNNKDFTPIFNGMAYQDVLAFFKHFEKDITSYVLNIDELAYINKKGGEIDMWSDYEGVVTDIYKIKQKIDGAVIVINSSKEQEIKDFFKENKLSISPRFWHSDVTFDSIDHQTLLELHDNTFNKGTAIKLIKEYYQGQFDQVIAIGDSANDIDMLKVADIPVVMKNARPEAKPYAKVIAPSNNYNGVMKVLQKIID